MKHLSLAFIALTLASCGGGTDTPVNESPVEAVEIVNPFEPINGDMQEAISEPPVTVPQDTPVDALIEPVLIADPVQPVVAEPEPVVQEPGPTDTQLILSPVYTSERFNEEWRGSENPSPFVIVDIRIEWEAMPLHRYSLVVGEQVEQSNVSSPVTRQLVYPGLLETFDYSQIQNMWIRMCVGDNCEDMSAVFRQPVAEVQPVAIEEATLAQPTGYVAYQTSIVSVDVNNDNTYLELLTTIYVNFEPNLSYSISVNYDEWVPVFEGDAPLVYADLQNTIIVNQSGITYPEVRIQACNDSGCSVSDILTE